MVKFPDKVAKKKIVEAITAAEKLSSGEIRVHVQSRCKENALHEAKKVFHRLKMHKTKEHHGVLIFVALESRRFAILGDRGIHGHVGGDFWARARDAMAGHFSEGKILEGIVAGIEKVGEELKKHFPNNKQDRNELSDTVTGSYQGEIL